MNHSIDTFKSNEKRCSNDAEWQNRCVRVSIYRRKHNCKYESTSDAWSIVTMRSSGTVTEICSFKYWTHGRGHEKKDERREKEKEEGEEGKEKWKGKGRERGRRKGKGQARDPVISEALYLHNGAR